VGEITREDLAKQLILETEENGGSFGVEVLELECKKFLEDKPRLLPGVLRYIKEKEVTN